MNLYICLFLILVCIAGVKAEIVVPDDFASIQAAIDNASSGSIIVVKDGVYKENIVIRKPITLVSKNGASKCIIKALNHRNALKIEASNVKISGFTIKGSGNFTINSYALIVSDAKNVTVSNNVIKKNFHGIALINTTNSIIENNVIVENNLGVSIFTSKGIYLRNSSKNLILNNIVEKNHVGMVLKRSYNNTIKNNLFKDNSYRNHKGVYLDSSNKNILENNRFINNSLFIYDSYRNIVKNNIVNGKPLVYFENTSNVTISNAGQVILINCSRIEIKNSKFSRIYSGVLLWNTSKSKIINNTFTQLDCGIDLYHSNKNLILNNNFKGYGFNGMYLYNSSENEMQNNVFDGLLDGLYGQNILLISGIHLVNSENNTILNNIFRKNTEALVFWNSCCNEVYLNALYQNQIDVNLYDSYDNLFYTFDPVAYEYGGKVLINRLGNYWDRHEGEDLNRDGIGDAPYLLQDLNLENNIFDQYPLVNFPLTYGLENGVIVVPSHFSDIRSAIKNAKDGDTIIVKRGTYKGFLVNKRVKIIGLGKPKIVGGVKIFSECTLKGFTIMNSTYGILIHANNVVIKENEILNNKYGIYIEGAKRYDWTRCPFDEIEPKTTNVSIENNNIENNNFGIFLFGASGNNIIGNSMINNCLALNLISSPDNLIYLNSFIGNQNDVHDDSNNFYSSDRTFRYWHNGYLQISHLGNYWNKYNGSDSDNDGVFDEEYESPNITDSYPLAKESKYYTHGDLYISDINAYLVNNYLRFDVKIGCEGKDINEPIFVAAYVDGKLIGIKLFVTPMSKVTFNYAWNLRDCELLFFVDSSNVIEEFSENNNIVRLTLHDLLT